jgi:hypothetical protein
MASNAEHVAVGMPNVHLARVPLDIRRRPRNLAALLDAARMHPVDVVDPHRHPDTRLERRIRWRAKGHRQTRVATPALLGVTW